MKLVKLEDKVWGEYEENVKRMWYCFDFDLMWMRVKMSWMSYEYSLCSAKALTEWL